MRQFTGILASALLIICVSATAWSSEADELRAKAKAVQHEAEVLAKEGRKEEAEKLFRHAKELIIAASKHDEKAPKKGDSGIDELHQQLKAIAEKEEFAEKSKNKEALAELRKLREAIERELAEHREHHEKKIGPKHAKKVPSESQDGLDDVLRRIKHIRIAAENLQAAGLHDLAEELAKRAEAMERELPQHHEVKAKTPGTPQKSVRIELPMKRIDLKINSDPNSSPINELREELQRLRGELKELREEIKNRP